jgi:signal transduction histidine kinase
LFEEFLPLAQDAGVQLRCEPCASCAVACDPAILTVLISNLVRNAIKYIGDGPSRDVTLRVFEQGNDVRIEVADTGIGVPPELRHAIFEPFVRGRHAQSGVGLGLATVSRICERHRGRVGLESPHSGGSCFWVELPRVRRA